MSLYEKMTAVEHDAIESLRDRGFAVTVFNPEELEGSDPDTVQDLMTERGWNAIDTLKDR